MLRISQSWLLPGTAPRGGSRTQRQPTGFPIGQIPVILVALLALATRSAVLRPRPNNMYHIQLTWSHELNVLHVGVYLTRLFIKLLIH